MQWWFRRYFQLSIYATVIMSFEVWQSLWNEDIDSVTLVVLGELAKSVWLEHLLLEVGIFVSSLNELLHVLALMVELVTQMQLPV